MVVRTMEMFPLNTEIDGTSERVPARQTNSSDQSLTVYVELSFEILAALQ